MISDWLCVFAPAEERERERQRLQRSPQFAVISQVRDWLVAGERGVGDKNAMCGLLYSFGENAHKAQDAAHIVRLARELPEHLDQLPGDFSFVALALGGQATAVAACSGQGRWHFRIDGDRVLISTRQDWLAVVQGPPVELDPLATTLAILGYPGLPNLTSTLSGATTLRCGEFTVLSPHKAQVDCYWRPLPLRVQPPGSDQLRVVSARLSELLESNLGPPQASPSEGPVDTLVLHSGGLDSSLLVSFAQAAGMWLSAISLLPDTQSPVLSRELGYQALQHDAFKSTQQITATEANLKQLSRAERLLPSVAFSSLAAYARVRSPSTLKRVLSGYFADEAFGVWRRREWLRSTPPWRFPTLLQHQVPEYRVAKAWLTQFRHRPWGPPLPTELPEFYAPALREHYQSARSHSALNDTGHPGYFLQQLVQLTSCSGAFAETAKASGLSAVLPFTTREVLELAFNVHPSLLFHHGLAKIPLREAGRGRLPEALRSRSDKGVWPEDSAYRCHKPTISFPSDRWLDSAWLARHPTIPLRFSLQLHSLDQLHDAQRRLSHEQQAYQDF